MNINQTDLQIIKLLLISESYISSYEISTSLGMSRRFVRDEMNNVRKTLKSLGYTLESSTSKGYRIKTNSNSLSELLEVLEDAEKSWNLSVPQNFEERFSYIRLRLLRTDNYVKIDNLAEELSISRATISNDLKTVRADLEARGLYIKQKPNFGLFVEGSEIEHRKFICDIIFSQFASKDNFYEFLRCSVQEESVLESTIVSIINRYFGLSDIALADFLLYISVSLERINKNKCLTSTLDVSEYSSRIEFAIASEIAELIEKELGITLNQYEITQTAIELISRRASFLRRKEGNIKYYDDVYEILDLIYRKTRIDLRGDYSLRTFLSDYIPTALFRDKFNTKLRTPLYIALESHYPLAYSLVRIANEHFHEKYGFNLSSSERSWISVFMQNALLELGNYKKRVMVICGMGRGMTELVREQLSERFSKEFDIIDTIQYYAFKNSKVENYDFIISMIPLDEKLDVPVLKISSIFDERDVDKIRFFLDQNYKLSAIELCFNPELYINYTGAKRKNNLINAFIQNLKLKFFLTDNTINSAIMYDEKRFNVIEYEKGIAIVNIGFSINSSSIVSVLNLSKPFTWNTKPSRTFIFVSLKSKTDLTLLSITNAIDNYSRDTSQTKELADLAYEDFIDTLKQYEHRFTRRN